MRFRWGAYAFFVLGLLWLLVNRHSVHKPSSQATMDFPSREQLQDQNVQKQSISDSQLNSLYHDSSTSSFTAKLSSQALDSGGSSSVLEPAAKSDSSVKSQKTSKPNAVFQDQNWLRVEQQLQKQLKVFSQKSSHSAALVVTALRSGAQRTLGDAQLVERKAEILSPIAKPALPEQNTRLPLELPNAQNLVASPAPKTENHFVLDAGFLMQLKSSHEIYNVRCTNAELSKLLQTIMQHNEGVEHTEPNIELKLTSLSTQSLPNDINWQEQWGLQAMNLEPVWNEEHKADAPIIVAVIDTGLDFQHPDFGEVDSQAQILGSNIWQNRGEDTNRNGVLVYQDGQWQLDQQDLNGIDDDGNGYVDDLIGYSFGEATHNVMDEIGHGTHVSGIIAARSGNAQGICGISSQNNIQVMPLKVFEKDAFGREVCHLSSLAAALYYAIDNHARVVNLSLGTEINSYFLEKVIEELKRFGLLIVAAAGNSHSNQSLFPAGYKDVVAVAASTQSQHKAWYSNYGLWVDVVAPGSNVRSTYPDQRYALMSGTSMASPHAAGLAALLWSQKPDLSLDQLHHALRKTSVSLSHNSKWLGTGLLDAEVAMRNLENTPAVDIQIPMPKSIIVSQDNKQRWRTALNADEWRLVQSDHPFADAEQTADESLAQDFVAVWMRNDDLSVRHSAALPRQSGLTNRAAIEPTLVNLDGDLSNGLEIVIRDSAFNAQGQLLPNWPINSLFVTGFDLLNPIACGDLTGDGAQELVYKLSSSRSFKILIVRADGQTLAPVELSGLTQCNFSDFGFQASRDLVLADVNNDGRKDIVLVVDQDRHVDSPSEVRVYSLERTDSVSSSFQDQWALHQEWTYHSSNLIIGAPTVVDIDQDQKSELLFQELDLNDLEQGSWNTRLVTLNHLGGPQKFWKIFNCVPAFGTSIAVGDLNRDGSYELVLTSLLGDVFAFNPAGLELWRTSLQDIVLETPILADVNSNGSLEVLINSGTIQVLDALGQEYQDLAVQCDGDLDGFLLADIDSAPGLELIACSSAIDTNAKVFAWTELKTLARAWPVEGSDYDMSTDINFQREHFTCCVGDLDQDGFNEIVLSKTGGLTAHTTFQIIATGQAAQSFACPSSDCPVNRQNNSRNTVVLSSAEDAAHLSAHLEQQEGINQQITSGGSENGMKEITITYQKADLPFYRLEAKKFAADSQ